MLTDRHHHTCNTKYALQPCCRPVVHQRPAATSLEFGRRVLAAARSERARAAGGNEAGLVRLVAAVRARALRRPALPRHIAELAAFAAAVLGVDPRAP